MTRGTFLSHFSLLTTGHAFFFLIPFQLLLSKKKKTVFMPLRRQSSAPRSKDSSTPARASSVAVEEPSAWAASILGKLEEIEPDLSELRRQKRSPVRVDAQLQKKSCKQQMALLEKNREEGVSSLDVLDSHPSEAKGLLQPTLSLLQESCEHIRIAGRFGWDVLSTYLDGEVMENEEKRKRLERARSEVNYIQRQNPRPEGGSSNFCFSSRVPSE